MYKTKADNLNLDQIAESGQCFRWRRLDEGKYEIEAFGRVLTAGQKGNEFELSCDEKVRETVEGLEKAGDHVGNGEADQGTEYIPSGEILLHVKILPESTECFLRRGLPRRDRKIVAFTPASCNHVFRASA